MRKYLHTILPSICLLAMTLSCSDDEPTPMVAIKEVRITPADNAIAVACTGSAYSSELDNRNDSIDFDVAADDLKQASMEVETTLGIGIEAYYNDEPIRGAVVVDATQPIRLEVKGYGQTRSYTVHVYQAQVNKAGEEPRLKSSDMRKMGIHPDAYDFDVALFHDRFYALMASKTDGKQNSLLYVSDNGIKWSEVPYDCKDADGHPALIGGRGARLAVSGDRLYVLSGGRFDGDDVYGNPAELDWGLPIVKNWRSFSTTDGTHFRIDTVGIGYRTEGTKQVRRAPTPTCYPTVAVFGNRLYYQGGYPQQVFGMWQFNNQFQATADGVNWDPVTTSSNLLLTNRHCAAYFTFKGRLWMLGGFTSFVSASNLKADIYSSPDGIDWTLEAETSALGALQGVRVVATDEAAYAFGGEYFDAEGKKTVSNQVYRSTDGVHWEPLEVASSYVARRSPVVVVKDGMAYIFGGYASPSDGSYAYPTDKDTLFDTYVMSLQ